MKPANFVQYLIDIVQKRANSIATEISLCDEQLKHIGACPGTTDIDRKQMILHRNIKATLHDVLLSYIAGLKAYNLTVAPLKMAISCHMVTINEPKFQILLSELYGQQSALNTLVGSDYQKYTKDDDVPADIHLRMIALIFPFEFLVELLRDVDFFQLLLKTIVSYNPAKHTRAVKTIFNAIKSFSGLKNISVSTQFFTASDVLFFALAEHLVTIFTHQIMLRVNWQPMRNFSTAEKSALIGQNGTVSLKLNEKVLAHLLKYPATPQPLPEGIRPILIDTPDLEFDENEVVEVPALMHIVLELRKMSLQPSPSLVLYIMSNALTWLTSAVSMDGSQVGADDTFQFFVFTLAVARVWCLPALVAFIERFIDDSLRYTKFEYLITQLKCALEFIEGRLLPVKPALLFPHVNLPSEFQTRMKPLGEPETIRRFAVYAFPSFSPRYEAIFPAMLRYTGNLRDVAIVQRYSVIKEDNSKLPTAKDVDSVPSLRGTFYQISQSFIEREKMIKVEGGDMISKNDDLVKLSAMFLMTSAVIPSPSTSLLNILFDVVKEEWKISGKTDINRISLIIADLQKSLVIIGELNDSHQIDGVLDWETYAALKRRIGSRGLLMITPKGYEYVMNLAQRALE